MAVVAWDCADDEYRERAYNGMAADIERLRAALRDLLAWDDRNGGYGELPPLMRAAKDALDQ